MSVPTRVKQPPALTPPPPMPGMAPVANNSVGRGGTTTGAPAPLSTPPLPDLIKNQPLPDPMTDQYNQLLAMYQAQQAQMAGYGTGMLGMQNTINQLTQQSGNNPLQRQLLAQYQGDPYAALRAQQLQQEQGNPRLNMAFYVGDY